MKKIAALIVIVFMICACTKTVQTEKTDSRSIIGKWKISDGYGSPGGGVDIDAVPWIPVPASNTQYLEFKSDGVFINSSDRNFVQDRYVVDATTITIIRGSKETRLGYKLAAPYLEIYGNISFDYFCSEFCGSRFVKAF